MTAAKGQTLVFTERGNIERWRNGKRGRKGSFKWFVGYSETTSEGGVTSPWMTRAECRTVAESRGMTAVFKKKETP